MLGWHRNTSDIGSKCRILEWCLGMQDISRNYLLCDKRNTMVCVAWLCEGWYEPRNGLLPGCGRLFQRCNIHGQCSCFLHLVKGDGQKIYCVQQLGKLYRHRFAVIVELNIWQLEGLVVKRHYVFYLLDIKRRIQWLTCWLCTYHLPCWRIDMLTLPIQWSQQIVAEYRCVIFFSD